MFLDSLEDRKKDLVCKAHNAYKTALTYQRPGDTHWRGAARNWYLVVLAFLEIYRDLRNRSRSIELEE